MLRQAAIGIAALAASLFAAGVFAFSQVDVNQADQAALDGVRGIGPTTSRAILQERKSGGNFRNWADFEKRVKGIGEKKAALLSQAGLTVNGSARSKRGVPDARPSSAR